MLDHHPTLPSIHISIPGVVGLIIAALTLSGLYWNNHLDIVHLQDEAKVMRQVAESQEKELQKLTDKHISDIDEVVAHKDAELKEI